MLEVELGCLENTYQFLLAICCSMQFLMPLSLIQFIWSTMLVYLSASLGLVNLILSYRMEEEDSKDLDFFIGGILSLRVSTSHYVQKTTNKGNLTAVNRATIR